MKLGDIVQGLRQTYCESIGAEYMHVVDTRIKRWFQQRMAPVRSRPEYATATRKHILERLTAAEGLEKYLGSRYPGAKRCDVEGGARRIPCLGALIQRAGS